MKLCKDCKHYQYVHAGNRLWPADTPWAVIARDLEPRCKRQDGFAPDPVHGTRYVDFAGRPLCRDERHDEQQCGIDARYYEPHTPQEEQR